MPRYIVGNAVFNSFLEYRTALNVFRKRANAADELEQNSRMQTSLLEAFLTHYHPDPGTEKEVLERRDILGFVITEHPEWKTACFGVVRRSDGVCLPFSIGKGSFTAQSRELAGPPTAGELRRRAIDAFRLAVKPSINTWIANNPVPEMCPVSGKQMGALSDREDPLRRTLPTTPTIDHDDPDFQTLLAEFLDAESLELDEVPLGYDFVARIRVLESDTFRERWIAHHDSGTLRWLSLEGNQSCNSASQR